MASWQITLIRLIQRGTRRLVRDGAKIEANEVKATIFSFLFVFIISASYYIIKNVRDGMVSDWTDSEVSWLWTVNFFICIAAVAIYGFAVSRIKFKYLVHGIYTFFAGSFLCFYFGSNLIPDPVLIDKTFYVWVSFFAMFYLSVFWSYMSDLFNREQAIRLFPIIGAGVSAGGLLGPLVPTLLTKVLGLDTLTLIASVLLLLTIPMTIYLAKLKVTDLHNADLHVDPDTLKIGGNPFAGFKLFILNPYLLSIGVFIFLYVTINTFIYFEQKNILEVYDRETRTQIVGGISFLVNFLTFAIAFFATSRIVKKCGMSMTLALTPILLCAGMLILAFAPIVTVILALQVVRSVGTYAITRPAREMLFTEVDRESRFKAKPVIDVVIYRGGDVGSSWIYTGLTEGIGLGFAAVGIVGAVIAAVWAGIGLYLGRLYNGKYSRSDQTFTQASKSLP